MNRNDSQGLAIVARPDKSLNRHFVATSQLAPPGSAVGTALAYWRPKRTPNGQK